MDHGLNSILDAICTVEQANFMPPDGIILHNKLWTELSKTETTSAGYYLGSPAERFELRLWGLPVRKVYSGLDHGSQGDYPAIVGVFNPYNFIAYRQDVMTEMGFINDDFTKGLRRMLATVRACFINTRPTSLCKVRSGGL